jgi:carbonic anhydrase/acetyltransferase-like protein (isoleucine patch superfamily)
VNVAARAVIHPYATVSSMAGAVDIGEGAVVWERSSVGASTGIPTGHGDTTTRIEKDVVIETGASIAVGASIGEGSVVECFAKVGRGANVGKVGRDFVSPMMKFKSNKFLVVL